MAITIHQRPHLYLWHWKQGPGWCRSASPELKALKAAGARVLKVQMQDDGDLDPDVVKMWRSIGYKFWPMMWPAGSPLGGNLWGPREAAQWFKGQKDRMVAAGTNFDGVDFNFEDNVRNQDSASNGAWSETFAKRFRELCPTLPAHLDTYFGSAAGGLNLGAYVSRAFRMSIQSFWGNEGLYEDPVCDSPGTQSGGMVTWCKNAQPSIPKAQVKPILRVSPNNSGQLPDYERVLSDCVKAGTKGIGLYYIDGGNVEQMVWLIREAIKRGASY